MWRVETLVIGGGPAGLLAALHLRGDSMLVEARPSVGRPPHCAGIVSVETARLLPHEALEEYYDGLYLLLGGSYIVRISVRLARVNRPLLEDILVSRLEDKGVKLETRCRADEVIYVDGHFTVHTRCGTILASNVVVAEGAAARLAQSLGFSRPRLIHGYQVILARHKPIDVEPRAPLAMLVGGSIKYAWLAPYGEQRLLLGAAGESRVVFKFVSRAVRRLLKRGWRIVEERSSPIPYSKPMRRIWRIYGDDRWALVLGDAAGLTKATSGGGLYAITRLARLAVHMETGKVEQVERVYALVRSRLLRLYILASLFYSSRVSTAILTALYRAAIGSRVIELSDYDELGVTSWGSRSYVELPGIYLEMLQLLGYGRGSRS